MDVILIPGFWLDASSWDAVVPALEAAGHRAHAVTRYGESPAAQLAPLVELVDELDGPVGVVAHSAAALLGYGLADARPDRIARVVYVDTFPLPARGPVESEFPVVGDAVPLPDWDEFEEPFLTDLDEATKARMRAEAVLEPLGWVTGPYELHDERRRAVPSTVLATSYSAAWYAEEIAQGTPWLSELAALEDVRWVDLPTGHWPQFTKPRELAQALVAEFE